METKVSFLQTFKTTLRAFFDNIRPMAALFLVNVLFGALPMYCLYKIYELAALHSILTGSSSLSFINFVLLALLVALLWMFFYAAILNCFLSVAKNKPVSESTFWKGFSYGLSLGFINLLLLSLILFGLLAFIIPGIYLSIVLSFTNFFVLENYGLQAFSKSAELTKGYRLRLLFLFSLLWFIHLVIRVILGPSYLAVSINTVLCSSFSFFFSLFFAFLYVQLREEKQEGTSSSEPNVKMPKNDTISSTELNQ